MDKTSSPKEPKRPNEPKDAMPETDVAPNQEALQAYERFLERGIGEYDSLSEWIAEERRLRSRLRPSVDEPHNGKPKDSGSR